MLCQASLLECAKLGEPPHDVALLEVEAAQDVSREDFKQVLSFGINFRKVLILSFLLDHIDHPGSNQAIHDSLELHLEFWSILQVHIEVVLEFQDVNLVTGACIVLDDFQDVSLSEAKLQTFDSPVEGVSLHSELTLMVLIG